MSTLDFAQPAELQELAEVAADYLSGQADGATAGAELGWFGVGIPEERGGAGGTREHVAVLAEAAGAALAASPIGFTAGVAGQLLLEADPVSSASLLEGIISGSVLPFVPAIDPRAVAAGAVPDASGRLTATVSVYGAATATIVVLPIGGSDPGVAFFDVATPGIDIVEQKAMDVSRPLFAARVTGVDVRAASLVLPGVSAIERMTALAALMTALDSAGVAKKALEATIAFAEQRVQYGRTIASFQAYKHRCASAFVLLRLSQSVAFRASRPGGLESAYSAAMDATRNATEICGEAVQLQGAMGFSWETGTHVYLKRARANELFWRPTFDTMDGPRIEED